MPKGHKIQNGYATRKTNDCGLDYRAIAKKMTDDGTRMNHATAHKIFNTAMQKLAQPIHEFYGVSSSDEMIARTANDPRFQSGIADLISNGELQL